MAIDQDETAAAKAPRATKTKTARIARDYFESVINDRDLGAYDRLWHADGSWHAHGILGPVGLDEARGFWASTFEAIPDLRLEILDVTAETTRAVVRWQMRGTFAGPGSFQGLAPTGAPLLLEGADILFVRDDRIERLEGYVDNLDVAQQLGLLPPKDSALEQRMKAAFNLKTRVAARFSKAPEKIAEGVWLLRGGFPGHTMNVYVIEEAGGGVTLFDAGVSAMAKQVGTFGAQLGGINRVVLGHADADHRGSAPALGAPVFCHPLEVEAAQLDETFRPYWNLDALAPHGKLLLGNLLPRWDGGAVEIAGTVSEGDEVAGFRVVEIPGHAPGMIALWREEDRLALVSDLFYVLDPQTGRPKPAALPHEAFTQDSEQARASLRKIAALDPAIAAPGHLGPITGDVRAQLERAAVA